jgi:hypothetical protein
MRFEFHDPAGAVSVSRAHAPRIDSLAGKTIGFLTNEQWQAHRMLPLLKELIEADFPSARVLPIDAFPAGNAEIPRRCARRASMPSSSATPPEGPAPQHAAVQPLGSKRKEFRRSRWDAPISSASSAMP